MEQSAGNVQMGLMDQIKSFDIHGVWESIKAYHIDWLELGIGFAMGVLAGFLFKRYSKIVLIALAAGTATIFLLDYFNFVHIDWTAVQSMVGTKPLQEEVSSKAQAVIAWIKLNVVMTTSFGLGFLVGLKVG